MAAATFISMPMAKNWTIRSNGSPDTRSTTVHSRLNPARVAARMSGSSHAA